MILTLKDWYQLDFVLPAPEEAKRTLIKVSNVIEILIDKKIVNKWFFLFEGDSLAGDSLRVRMKSNNKDLLESSLKIEASKQQLKFSDKLPFSDYQESDAVLFNERFLRSFANIMCEVSEIAIAKLNDGLNFDNYRAIERLNHCIFDVFGTLSFKGELYFITQYYLEKSGQPFDGNFEDK